MRNTPVTTKVQLIQAAVITVLSLDVYFNSAEAKFAMLDSGIKSGYNNRIEF